MKLLLDTHAVLWAWELSPLLSAKSHAAIADPENLVLVSAVSAFELSIKFHLGKLPGADRAVREFSSLMRHYRMEELAVSISHSQRAGEYRSPHRDPFDRLLAAQAEAEDATLVTRDPAFAHFPCRTFW